MTSLDELRAAHDEALVEPFRLRENDGVHYWKFGVLFDDEVGFARAVVSAWNALPGLLDRVAAAEAERDALRAALEALVEDVDDAYGPGDDGPALAAARAFLAAAPSGPAAGGDT